MPATKQVHVEVKNALSTVRMCIDDNPETVVLQPFLSGNPFCQINHFGNQLWRRLQNGGYPFLRNYQDVNWRLWILVSNGESVFRLSDVTLGSDILEGTWFQIQLGQLLGGNLRRGNNSYQGEANECQTAHQ